MLFLLRFCFVFFSFISFATAGHALAAPSVDAPDEAAKAVVASSMMKMPMLFEENKGQSLAGVDFTSRGLGYSVGLSEGGVASIRLNTSAKDNKTEYLRIRPVGGSAKAISAGTDKHQATFNYFRGSDKSKWVTDAQSYQKVQYNKIYPGVDLVYYGNQKKLEYDFVVSPGTDPKVIGLSFDGAKSVTVDKNGDLVLGLDEGDIVLQAPISYQMVKGKRVSVDSKYVVGKDNRVAFAVGAYDKAQALVIDPVLAFSTIIGGTGNDTGYDIDLDSVGNIYITGYTDSPDLTYRRLHYHLGASDIYVIKLDPNGVILFSAIIGGTGNDTGKAIDLDSVGNIYLAGTTSSTDYPVVGWCGDTWDQ